MTHFQFDGYEVPHVKIYPKPRCLSSIRRLEKKGKQANENLHYWSP
jgi:hypothetical protein